MYICKNCQYRSSKWMGRCPNCQTWESFVLVEKENNSQKATSSEKIQLLSIDYTSKQSIEKIKTHFPGWDAVLGEGMIPGTAILLSGPPGIGKSTLSLQLADQWGLEKKVLSVCCEESFQQIQLRFHRLKLKSKNIHFLVTHQIQQIFLAIQQWQPSFVLLDSLQSIYDQQSIKKQNNIKDIVYELVQLCKSHNITLLMITHITKDGSIAGPKLIEHMVDVVIHYGRLNDQLRYLKASKNRFGPVGEMALLEMTESGLKTIQDASNLFLVERKNNVWPIGVTVAPLREGTQTFLLEIQALVTESKTSVMRTFSDKLSSKFLLRLAAILEKHTGCHLSHFDLYAHLAGGWKTKDMALDLPLVMAMYSSYVEKPIPYQSIFLGELSLAGEIRPVDFLKERLRLAFQWGAKNIYIPPTPKKDLAFLETTFPNQKVNIRRITTVQNLIQEVFP